MSKPFTMNDGLIASKRFYAFVEGEGKVSFYDGRPFTWVEFFKRFVRDNFGVDKSTYKNKRDALEGWGYLTFDHSERVFFNEKMFSDERKQKTIGGFGDGSFN